MKISFCTTCMGRFHHLKETLPQNIRDNLQPAGSATQVQFVVLDYASRDGLGEWMMSDPEMADYMAQGILKYARFNDAERFHYSHAKNMAHRLADGDIVCNLDADNYTGPGFADFLDRAFSENPHIMVHPNFTVSRNAASKDAGFFGRIAMMRENFMRLGGYDEKYLGYGHEDTQLLVRGFASGLKSHSTANVKYLKVIGHGNDERIENVLDVGASLKVLSAVDHRGMDWLKGRLQTHFRLSAGLAEKNHGTDFGLGRVFVGRNQTEEVIGPFGKSGRSYQFSFLGLAGYLKARREAPPAESEFDLLQQPAASKLKNEL